MMRLHKISNGMGDRDCGESGHQHQCGQGLGLGLVCQRGSIIAHNAGRAQSATQQRDGSKLQLRLTVSSLAFHASWSWDGMG
jgi:K+-sensing histidine kinase KdpD